MMRPILLLFALLLAGYADSAPNTFRVYFGTSAKGEQCGIYMAELDMKAGTLSKAARVSKALRPGFITIHPDGKHLYATGAGSTCKDPSPGMVSAYKIAEDGLLTDINSQSSGGRGPCHVSLDTTGKYLLAANYAGGSCSVLPILPDGSLAPLSSTRQHTGSSVHPRRQTKAYAHSINTSPDGRFAFTADLGTDKIMIYRFDPETGTLEPNDPPFAQTEAGGGPRHFTFHPNGKFAYTNLELSNKVTAFRYNGETGALKEIQTTTTLPDDYSLQNTTAEIITSADGRFLYVSNRGHNSIAIYSIDAETGKPALLGHESVHGQIPRNFNIDPTGTFLLVANQKSCNIVVFRIDRKTGKFKFTGSEIEVPNPICVRFLAVP